MKSEAARSGASGFGKGVKSEPSVTLKSNFTTLKSKGKFLHGGGGGNDSALSSFKSSKEPSKALHHESVHTFQYGEEVKEEDEALEGTQEHLELHYLGGGLKKPEKTSP